MSRFALHCTPLEEDQREERCVLYCDPKRIIHGLLFAISPLV